MAVMTEKCQENTIKNAMSIQRFTVGAVVPSYQPYIAIAGNDLLAHGSISPRSRRACDDALCFSTPKQ